MDKVGRAWVERRQVGSAVFWSLEEGKGYQQRAVFIGAIEVVDISYISSMGPSSYRQVVFWARTMGQRERSTLDWLCVASVVTLSPVSSGGVPEQAVFL